MSETSPSAQQFDGMQFDPPESFQLVETMLSLRAPARQELADPRLVQGITKKQTIVQPNLIVHRRKAKSGADLESLVGEACAEFVRSLVRLENMDKQDFAFNDENPGFLVMFDFPTKESQTLRQYHAFRLDGDKFTTLTLTVDGATLTDDIEETYLDSLASLTPTS